MDTVENNFYSKTWTIYISIQYIFKHDLDLKVKCNFKLVKTLVFCLLRDAAVAAN